MHLLCLTENYYPNQGGMAQSCDRITQSLGQRGIQVDLLHFTNRRPAFRTEKQVCGSYTACPVFEDSAHTLNRLWNFLSRPNQPKYTHLFVFGGFLPILAAPILKAWLSIPLITCIRGNDFDVSIFSPRRRPMLRACFEQSAHVCTVSANKAWKINRWLGKPIASFTPNGLNLATWQNTKGDLKQAENWRDDHVPDNKRVIGLFGHLKNKKGLDFFLKALYQNATQDKIHLMLIGDLETNSRSLLQDSGISYHAYPFMDRYKLLSYYPACDLIALPSFYDGMPNVLLEAGALGLPFLASKVDGMEDLLKDQEQGFLFHPGNLDACRSAISRFQKASIEDLRAMGKSCKELIVEQYTHEIEISRYVKILENSN